jgi:hypothetical protein
MSKYTKWFTAAIVAVLVLGALGTLLIIGWFVVRPAIAGSPTPWMGPGMMGRSWRSGGQPEGNTQDLPEHGCTYSGEIECSYGATGKPGMGPDNTCLYGEGTACPYSGAGEPAVGPNDTCPYGGETTCPYVGTSRYGMDPDNTCLYGGRGNCTEGQPGSGQPLIPEEGN